jgi:hypothetical protein
MKYCLQAGANAAEEAALQTSSTNKGKPVYKLWGSTHS